MPKKGNAYLDGTVHVAKEVQTIQRFLLELYMWEKRYKPNSGTVHVAKCSSSIWTRANLSDTSTGTFCEFLLAIEG